MRFSSGRSSSIATLTPPTRSSCCEPASTTSMPDALAVPVTFNESFGRCSKAMRRSVASVAARSCAGRPRGR
jgi:hypothetical protein